jgi:hypothetical protein
MESRKVDLRHEVNDFGTIAKAWRQYEKLGYHPADIDGSTGKKATIETPSDRVIFCVVRANGLCLVHCGDGAPAETGGKEWEAPCFIDDATGAVTWVFASIGEVSIADCIGYSVQSYAALPSGWEQRFEKFVEFPNGENGLTWLRPPTQHVDWLKPVPAVLRHELAYMRAQAEGW